MASGILDELFQLKNQSIPSEDNKYLYEKFICINEEKILNLEQKIFSFNQNKNYDYALSIVYSNNILPKININLTELNSTLNKLIINVENSKNFFEEIDLANYFYEILTSQISKINLEKRNIREQSIIFYLFYFMTNVLFYIILNPNFSAEAPTFKKFIDFFTNYITIRKAAELYLNKEEIKESHILLIHKNEIVDEFYEISYYKKEFEKIIKILMGKFNSIILAFKIDKGNKITLSEENLFIIERYVLILNIFHSINEKYKIIDYKCFYNGLLSKYLYLEKEFEILLENEKILKDLNNKEKNYQFTLLNYIWLFDPSGKYKIIQLFNNEKKKQQIKENSFSREFNLIIRRNNIIEDTFEKIYKNQNQLYKKLKIKFLGEIAEDWGGVKKEFFMLLIKQLFDVNYGMFIYNEKSRLFWFNLNSYEEIIKYELIGTIIGLAVYNGVMLDVKFPSVIYKKLLGIEPCLNDLKQYDEELYNNLQFLIDTNDKNLKESLDTNFTVCVDNFGEKNVIPLKPDGENIMIDLKNKKEYVYLYVNWFFNESIKEFYKSFEKGFYKVFDKELSKILSPEELELVVCGSEILDFKELQKAAKYEGYTSNSITIKYFWEIIKEFNEEKNKKILFFITGCNRAPINGLSSLDFTISRSDNINDLPSSHTCFNNLILPDYQNKELMKSKILIAINYSEGFGLK